MSLSVWLPLNGNLENQGASNVTVTNNGATVNTNGKIGSCYDFSSSAWQRIAFPYNLSNATEFSICLWHKPISTNISGVLFTFSRTSSNYWQFAIYQNNLTLRDSSTGVTGTRKNYSLGTFVANQWVHLTFTYNRGTVNIYKDGSLFSTNNTGGTSMCSYAGTTAGIGETITNNSSYYLGGSINDFRIYDHCLSAAEVHEISQGLVLHYKLDSPYIETSNNLLAVDKSYEEPYDYALSHETSTNAYINAGTLASSVGNNIVTYSVYITNNSDTTMQVRMRGMKTDGSTWGSYVNGNTIAAGTSGWAEVTLDMTDTSVYNGTSVYVRWQLGKARNTITGNALFYHAQLEVRDHRSPWTLGGTTRSGYVQDSSGYGHNGTILGSPIISSDTARYNFSTSFPANADGILSTYPIALWNNAFTYNFWIKPSGENGGRSVYAASYNGTSCSIEKTAGNKLRFYWSGSPDLSTSSLTITDGIWQHVAIVKEENKTTVKCYYNGILKDTFTNTFSDKTFSGNLRIARDTRGDATSYTGAMSDFRIYCTALSAADIKQLYEMGAKVDNKQGWHTYEYIDGISKETITKTGKTAGHNIIETYLPLYDKTIYTEPDGSKWIHIFHHNNPAGSKFDFPTTDWLLGKYMDANRWYDVDQAIYNSLSPYEFMVKQKTTSSATETKYRWRQTANPLTAVWADVKPGTPTFITTSGYSSSSQGGLYIFKSSNLHMCIANGSSGNWFGGIGAATAYNGGIPGYPNTTVTDGSIDLYMRVYADAKIIKDIGINAANLIEL